MIFEVLKGYFLLIIEWIPCSIQIIEFFGSVIAVLFRIVITAIFCPLVVAVQCNVTNDLKLHHYRHYYDGSLY